MIATNTQDQVKERNVLGGPLGMCSIDPLTGFYRNGCCLSGPQDQGSHTVCCVMSDAFLVFSQMQGNDLITPREEWGFSGLKAGDRWCLCAMRWLQAYEQDMAPLVVLESTHAKALEVIPLEALRENAFD